MYCTPHMHIEFVRHACMYSGTIKALSRKHSRRSTVEGPLSKERRSNASFIYIKRTWKRLSANPSHACNHIATKPPHRFGTPTVECSRGGDVRKCTSAKERAAKNQKTTVCHLRRKYADFCARFARCYCGSAVIEISLPSQTASSPPFFLQTDVTDDVSL